VRQPFARASSKQPCPQIALVANETEPHRNLSAKVRSFVDLMIAHFRKNPDWAARKGEDGLRAYQAEKNRRSIDDLPAIDWA
jgi:hypothetical protein